MTAASPAPERRRSRPGSLERPINARLYRGTWLLVGLPLSRPISYLARDNLFRVPVIGWILRHTYVKPINREAANQTVTTSKLSDAIN